MSFPRSFTFFKCCLMFSLCLTWCFVILLLCVSHLCTSPNFYEIFHIRWYYISLIFVEKILIIFLKPTFWANLVSPSLDYIPYSFLQLSVLFGHIRHSCRNLCSKCCSVSFQMSHLDISVALLLLWGLFVIHESYVFF